MRGFSYGERRIVLLSSAVHALVHAEMLVFAVVLLPLAAELGLSLPALGAIGTLSYLSFGAGAPAGGWMADRWGPRSVLVGCMLASAVALLGLTLARGPAQVAAAFVLLGLAASLYHPAGLGLVSTRVRALGPALAIHGMAGNLGLALAPFGAAALTDAHGWRAPYAVLAALAAILGLSLLGLERGVPVGTPAERARPEADRRSLALLLLLAPVLGLVYRGTLTFLPLRFLEAFADAQAAGALSRAGLLASAVLLGGMLGQLVAGRALARRPAAGLLVLALAAAAPLSAGLALLQGSALVGVAFLFVVAHFANQPLTNALVAEASPPSIRSRMYGLSFVLSFGVGAFAAAGGGIVAEKLGTEAVFLAIAALGVVGLMLGLALRAVRRASPPAAGRDPAVPLGL